LIVFVGDATSEWDRVKCSTTCRAAKLESSRVFSNPTRSQGMTEKAEPGIDGQSPNTQEAQASVLDRPDRTKDPIDELSASLDALGHDLSALGVKERAEATLSVAQARRELAQARKEQVLAAEVEHRLATPFYRDRRFLEITIGIAVAAAAVLAFLAPVMTTMSQHGVELAKLEKTRNANLRVELDEDNQKLEADKKRLTVERAIVLKLGRRCANWRSRGRLS